MTETGTHAADILTLFRRGPDLTRSQVISITGLSRSTVNQRLASLLRIGLIAPTEGGESTGGRPSTQFTFNGSRAVVLTADIGASGFVAAIYNLAGEPLRYVDQVVDVWEGPTKVLAMVDRAFRDLHHGEDLWGIGIGVPGPVEFAAGRVVNPPIMTGWDNYDIAGHLHALYNTVVIVEKDANARAVIESRQKNVDNLISLKLGTGIGSGLVFNGQIIRGDVGAAGDIGHTRVELTDDSALLDCRCGNVGCVEAYAGGWALARDLNAQGIETKSVSDVVELVRTGNIEAVRLVRQAGRVIGDAVANLVSILNPATVVVSGQLAECDELLLSGIRERVYQRSLPLATRNLQIIRSSLGHLVGAAGLALITTDTLFAADFLDRLLSRPQQVSFSSGAASA